MSEITPLDTGSEDLQARIEAGVAVLTMNRPDRRNALSAGMMEGFRRLLPRLAGNPAVGCVVLTGAGGAFCAGGDVRGMASRSRSGGGGEGPSLEQRIEDLRRSQLAVSAAIYEMPKPTLAMLPGPAAGAGLSIALACDLRTAAESAVLTTAFARVGFSGDYGGSWFLTRLVGSARARELYYLADRIDAKEAERLGVVNRVYPDAALEQETLALARRLASGPRVAYRYMKENLNRAVLQDLRPCLDAEAVAMIRTGQTEDHREAARAFVEKREPTFRGR